jgi:mannan endo-1,4-beta-mannosidase
VTDYAVEQVVINIAGANRSYTRSTPADYDPQHGHPLIFVFHGDGGTGADVRTALSLETATAEPALFVYPDATEASGRSFDLETPLPGNADMQLTLAVLNAMSATYTVDATRVFAAGISRGAYFVNFLNARIGSGPFRAIAAHSGSGPYGTPTDYDPDGHFICQAPTAAALLIHGMDDQDVPIADAEYTRGQWEWANRSSGGDHPVMWVAVPGLGHEIWDRASVTIGNFFAGFASTAPGPQPQQTMKVVGRTLVSAAGEPVLLRGVNKMNIFLDHAGDSFPEIRLSGANTVRIVWKTQHAGFTPTANDLDVVLGRALSEKLIPMPELHDATGDLAGVQAMTDYWTRPDIVAVLQKHQRWLLLNIANEAGDDTVTHEQFVTTYSAAIAQLRGAGIVTPLVIDAPDWGKNVDRLIDSAAELIAADPQHNLLFSCHPYWPMHGGADPAFIQGRFSAAVQAGVPLVIGELSAYGAYAGPNASMCSPAGEVDYQTILTECNTHQIGWYAWEWGPGNTGGGDPLCAVMDMTADSTFATLKTGWASDVVAAIQATSIVPPSLLL